MVKKTIISFGIVFIFFSIYFASDDSLGKNMAFVFCAITLLVALIRYAYVTNKNE
jgi:hypothetical protein